MKKEYCNYPDCTCPFDAPRDDWCALGLPHKKLKPLDIEKELFILSSDIICFGRDNEIDSRILDKAKRLYKRLLDGDE